MPTVLDCGGGSGTFAVPLAADGARVTVVDISADALATLSRRAAEAGVADRVVPVAGDVEALDAVAAVCRRDRSTWCSRTGSSVRSTTSTRRSPRSRVRCGPAGWSACWWQSGRRRCSPARWRATCLLRGANSTNSTQATRARPASVRALCDRHGLEVEQVHGIGVFTDLVPGAALDAPGARGALAELEAQCATRSPFADIAARVHVLARRPEG